jgi:hypothetical protein
MELVNPIVRPETLENGSKYLLQVRHENGRRLAHVPVTFERYDACPAVVVEEDGNGRLFRSVFMIPRKLGTSSESGSRRQKHNLCMGG